MYQTTTATDELTLNFEEFSGSIHQNFRDTIALNGRDLFTVDLADLNAIYLDNLPANQRQHHNCNCCRRFIERFGGLVSIDKTGMVRSAFWNPATAPEGYKRAAKAMASAVERAKVSGVFYCDDPIWGTPEAGGFNHFHAKNPAPPARGVLNAYQRMAAKREDFATLNLALREFTYPIVMQGIGLLEADVVTRAEKVIGPAKFLRQLHEDRAEHRGRGTNVTWLAVAKAPPGFCTPRSGMIGVLLEDLKAGKPIERIKASFADKMRGDLYQRPQAAPAAGNIAQAEKIVEQMGIEPALHRRYALIEEMKLLWQPRPLTLAAPKGGVFGHLDTKGSPAAPPPPLMAGGAMTWAKFRATVLPNAKRIEFLLRSSRNFCGILTATNPDAPPILQWDQPESRNPVSHYVYTGGSNPDDWGLRGLLAEVKGVMFKPHMWGDEEAYPHQEKGVVFILDGARDQRGAHLCLFPETLISDLHSVRSTIERHSQSRKASGKEEGTANGVIFSDRSPVRLRVTTDTGVTDITLDRWF